ncbi:hypothetical protein Mapa_016660 [Marchantia paleacea]|nr:hypothetical protein Mapa_016660 [Marchantia paleacea]
MPTCRRSHLGLVRRLKSTGIYTRLAPIGSQIFYLFFVFLPSLSARMSKFPLLHSLALDQTVSSTVFFFFLSLTSLAKPVLIRTISVPTCATIFTQIRE